MTYIETALEAAGLAPSLPVFNFDAIPEDMYHLFTRGALLHQIATNLVIVDQLEQAEAAVIDDAEVIVATVEPDGDETSA